ncbi:MAG: hypothetical protein WAO20_19410, partial [Acidobacteriota bacterium]
MSVRPPAKRSERLKDLTPEVRRLKTLLEVSRALSDTVSLKESLPDVVEILEGHPSISAALVRLSEEDGQELIFSSPGKTADPAPPSLDESAREIIERV